MADTDERIRTLILDAAAVLWGAGFQPWESNKYGSCVTAGYKVEFSAWPHLARVEHVLPESDLSDPNRLTADQRYEVRLEMRDAYAAVMREQGWSVQRKTVNVNRPILLVGRPKEASGG